MMVPHMMVPMALLLAVLLLAAPSTHARLTGLHDRGADLAPPPRVVPCEKPVARAEVDFPKELLNFDAAAKFKMHSGYINVTAEDYLFYWHFAAQVDALDGAPIILWSNGGPGCSAMEGATTEHGPLVLFDIKESVLGHSGQLSPNPYAWNKHAHVVYVDQPRYVGFSCGTGPYVTSSVDAGLDIVQFIQGWKKQFPEHAHRPWIIAAESYGGHYVPAWTGAILDHNERASPATKIDLSGIAIGNGIVNGTVQDNSFAEFAAKQGLIPPDAHPASDTAARMLADKTLGYSPNFYDYRLKSIDCCGCTSYNYSAWSHWFTKPAVTEALNVCGNAGDAAFAGCSGGCVDLPSFDRDDGFDYSNALSRALQQGIKLTFYYGKQDTACNYVGGYRVATESLQWAGAAAFKEAPLEPLLIGGVETGSYKKLGLLHWVEVDAAGHMVPLNNGAAGFWAIDTLVRPVLEEAAAAAAAPAADGL